MKASSQTRVFPSLAQMLLALVAFAALQYPLAAKADDVADGKAAFAVCSGCHTVSGKEGLGPHLNGVIGRKAGTVAGFNYSPAMKRSSIVWDATTLEHYIQNPQSAIPGNRMPFAGVQDEKKRDAIAAYLASLK
jgi:cytochrome c